MERASFETERRRRVQEYSSELEQLRSDENERLNKLAKEHESEMEAMMQRREDSLSEKKENLDEETGNWQRRRLMEIRQDAIEKDKDTYAALREQSEAELEMVIAKLEAQAKEERARIEAIIEKQLASVRDNLALSESKAVEEEQGERAPASREGGANNIAKFSKQLPWAGTPWTTKKVRFLRRTLASSSRGSSAWSAGWRSRRRT